jgi:NAD(P)H-flavin reductase
VAGGAGMNKPQRYTSRVIARDQYSPKVFLFTLQIEQDQTIDFLPGQFVSVQVGAALTRQYSIASPPSRNSTLDLLVDVAPGGPGSQFFIQQDVGSTIQFIGPMGKFVLEKEEGTIIFLATGTGIAPFKSMLDDLFEKQKAHNDYNKRSIHLFLGFRYEQDIFWHDYFEQKIHEQPNFQYVVTLSQPDEHWQGKRGYVQTRIDPQLLTRPDIEIYICGGNHMVKGSLEYLRSQKISEDKLHFEPF